MLTKIEINSKDFLHGHCSLPPLPEVVGKVQSMINDDNVEITKVADVISSDPAMLAQVLKVVNSAYYGLPREITKARYAITFLGYNEIYRMVLSLSVIKTIGVKDKKAISDYWRHSFYTAICARHLAVVHAPTLSLEELWSAAILHDIGKLVYLKFFPEHYEEISKLAEKDGLLFSDAESALEQPPSSEMGSLLCGNWRLPDTIRVACECHSLQSLKDLKSTDDDYDFKRMICLANLLAALSASPLSVESRELVYDAVSGALALDETEFLLLMADIRDLQTEVDGFMAQFS